MKRFVLFTAGLTLAAGVASAGDLHADGFGNILDGESQFPVGQVESGVSALCGSISLGVSMWGIRLSRSAVWKVRPAPALSGWIRSAMSGQATARS